MDRASQKKPKEVSNRVRDKVLRASHGQRTLATVQNDEIIDMLLRLTTKYFRQDIATTREYTQLCDFLTSEFKYLTIAEIELSIQLAYEEVIELPYMRVTIDREFATKLLKGYASFSYPIKMRTTEEKKIQSVEVWTDEHSFDRLLANTETNKIIPMAWAWEKPYRILFNKSLVPYTDNIEKQKIFVREWLIKKYPEYPDQEKLFMAAPISGGGLRSKFPNGLFGKR